MALKTNSSNELDNFHQLCVSAVNVVFFSNSNAAYRKIKANTNTNWNVFKFSNECAKQNEERTQEQKTKKKQGPTNKQQNRDNRRETMRNENDRKRVKENEKKENKIR